MRPNTLATRTADGGESGNGPAGWSHDPDPDPKFAETYRNGNLTVNVSHKAHGQVDAAALHGVMTRLDALRASDPTGYRLQVDVLHGKEMRSGTAGGETFTKESGDSRMELNAQTLEHGYQPRGETVFRKDPDATYPEYVVTHEYGHALQAAHDAERDDLAHNLAAIKIMKAEPAPSSYGNIRLTNEHEAYAEAFADWRLNAQPGPLANRLADHESWGPRPDPKFAARARHAAARARVALRAGEPDHNGTLEEGKP